MKKKKEHNQVMLDIASALSHAKFDDIKGSKLQIKYGMPYTLSMEETKIFKELNLRVSAVSLMI